VLQPRHEGASDSDTSEIDKKNLLQYKFSQALFLLGLMLAFALLLRPIGFVTTTTLIGRNKSVQSVLLPRLHCFWHLAGSF